MLGVNSKSKCVFTRRFPTGNPVVRLASHDTLYKRWQTFNKTN